MEFEASIFINLEEFLLSKYQIQLYYDESIELLELLEPYIKNRALFFVESSILGIQ